LSDAATEFKTCPAQQKEDLAWEIGCMYTAIQTDLEQDTIQVDQLCWTHYGTDDISTCLRSMW